jgi:hypothetical protein
MAEGLPENWVSREVIRTREVIGYDKEKVDQLRKEGSCNPVEESSGY